MWRIASKKMNGGRDICLEIAWEHTGWKIKNTVYIHAGLTLGEYGVKRNKEYNILLFVPLLSHFWLIHSFYLDPLYQPYVGLCQATCVQSHQRQPTSAVAIATCEVHIYIHVAVTLWAYGLKQNNDYSTYTRTSDPRSIRDQDNNKYNTYTCWTLNTDEQMYIILLMWM